MNGFSLIISFLFSFVFEIFILIHSFHSFFHHVFVFLFLISLRVHQVLTCSASQKSGISDVWKAIESLMSLLWRDGGLNTRRENQRIASLHRILETDLVEDCHARIGFEIAEKERQVGQGIISPGMAADALIALYKSSHGKN